MSGKHIPWFNPREMRDETVLALATGRSNLLGELLQAICQRSMQPGHITHWLLTGPRGAGKSYFLRLLQASLQQAPIENVRFVLLPEELPNIYAPHEFLLEIARMLEPSQQNLGHVAQWKVSDAARLWDDALQQLLAQIPNDLLVVGVENFDELIAAAFSNEIDNSRLRHLMSNQPRIMFVATSVLGDFDEKHAQRMFRQFEHRNLSPWNPQDHRDYLSARAKQQGIVSSPRQLNRIDAYSRYTGGNARAAAVLAATILEVDDFTVGAEDLDAAIEKMSDYYRALIKRIPINTMKLFDALVRGGEPASQTDIADRTGAKQSEISRAFAWLLDNGYVSETRETGQKAKQYRVLDRLLVQFYRMRYLQPGQRSSLAVMADLLADMLSFDEKWEVASRYVHKELMPEAQTLVELALRERQIDMALLPIELKDVKALIAKSSFMLKQDEVVYEIEGQRPNSFMHAVNAIIERFPTEQSFIDALQHAEKMAAACVCQGISGADIVRVVKEHPLISPLSRYILCAQILGTQRDFSDWPRRFSEQIQENKKVLQVYEQLPDELEKRRNLLDWEARAPLSFSLCMLAEMKIEALYQENLGFTPFHVVADWLVSAARYCSGHQIPEFSTKILDYFLCVMDLSLRQEYVPVAWMKLAESSAVFNAVMVDDTSSLLKRYKADALFEFGYFADAYTGFDKLREAFLGLAMHKGSNLPVYCLSKMAQCRAEMGEVDSALCLYSQVILECVGGGEVEAAAAAIGQVARYRIPQIGVAAAMKELDLAIQNFPEYCVRALAQIAEAILDKSRKDDQATAFGVGADILQELANRQQLPIEQVLRAFCLMLVNEHAPFALIRDLLGEWPRLWPNHAGVLELQAILLSWLDDLKQPPAEKEAKRKTLDPDLATTLAALEKALTPKARFRLGLI